MAKAFLSHSSRDKPLVEEIAKQLGRNNCHFDTLTFGPGQKTLDEIFKGLDDTDIFVLFISDSALASEWVQKEITQAKKLLEKNIIDRIFPLIIDKTITHRDVRIPDWIKKPYNLKHFDSQVLILKKIKQFLRESNFKKYSHLSEINDFFYGRNELMQEFERKLINIDDNKPTCIVTSSYFEGMGRRSFLKNGLIKTGIIDKWYDPVPIPISSRESIEDFIYKLNFSKKSHEVFEKDFSEEELSSKIQIAKDYLKKFVDSGEIIFLIDEGSIILPNHQIVNWFSEVISDPIFQNQICICLVSKFKPNGLLIRKMGNVIAFQIHELSVPDTQTFFIQYLKLMKQALAADDIRYFLKYLKGIPGQIIYATNLISTMGVIEAKRYVHDIEEFDTLRALSILDFLKDDPLATQILIALSGFEIISYDLVFKIFGESEDVNKAIQKLFDLALFYSVSAEHEYLKLNTLISDYINRSKLELNEMYGQKIKVIAKEALTKPLELNEYSDYSEFLFNLKQMIISDVNIPKKFLIPSFIVKSIIQEYYKSHYKTVISLANKILENSGKFDIQIIRETRNWLCLAYARLNDERFFGEIGYFKDEAGETNKDYHFLLGFYYRNADKMDDAERHFLLVLGIDENHSRTKRELVNVYLRKGEYSKALNWARDNYRKHRANILHIQAYFICLIKKAEHTEDDLIVIKELIDNANKSLDKKAKDIVEEMRAEYDYYIDGNYEKAVSTLEEQLKFNPGNYFAFKALVEIYKQRNKLAEIQMLVNKYPTLEEPDID